MEKKWVTLLVVLLVVIIAITALVVRGNGDISPDVAVCIGQKATLYVQFGCHACQIQEEAFAENYQYLNVVDCYFERDKCDDITATPTWIINGQSYLGVQSVDKLKELTGC